MQLSVHRWGLITPEECTALNELYQYNPLLFDVACKRLVSVETQDGKRVHFPVSVFNPLNTKLSCWNFNLVNADQFSRE